MDFFSQHWCVAEMEKSVVYSVPGKHLLDLTA